MQVIPKDVVAGAQASHKKWGVPASVSIAQWAIESGWGKHMPPGSNNPFGMKTRVGKNDPFVEVPTGEVIGGRHVTVVARFRKFPDLTAAFMAKGELLATAKVYATAFAKLPDVNAFINSFARIYATDPNYSKLIHSIIASNKLGQYDV